MCLQTIQFPLLTQTIAPSKYHTELSINQISFQRVNIDHSDLHLINRWIKIHTTNLDKKYGNMSFVSRISFPGPSTWVSKFPMAAGSRQSPVNIETDRVESDHEALINKPLQWKYPATASRTLVNPGYCWRMDTDGDGTCKCIFIFNMPV